jgi:hypothetical protein
VGTPETHAKFYHLGRFAQQLYFRDPRHPTMVRLEGTTWHRACWNEVEQALLNGKEVNIETLPEKEALDILMLFAK